MTIIVIILIKPNIRLCVSMSDHRLHYQKRKRREYRDAEHMMQDEKSHL
jgi:hypothetical protein